MLRAVITAFLVLDLCLAALHVQFRVVPLVALNEFAFGLASAGVLRVVLSAHACGEVGRSMLCQEVSYGTCMLCALLTAAMVGRVLQDWEMRKSLH